jgi:capsular exopolysaccharide synthesis family protein
VKESLYLFLLQKKEENELSITYNPVPIKTIDIPNGSGKPTSPKRLRILIVAVVMGMLFPLTLIFVMETMNETVRNRYDIESHGNIPFLGELPLTKRKRSLIGQLRSLSRWGKSASIVVHDGGQDLANEAFRVRRTRLEAINQSHVGRNVYMITSASKETGKTYVGMNLAIVLAIAMKRVLFIDADLRKGSASDKWNIIGMGLVDYLSGQVDDVDSLLFRQEKLPTLHVLPSGLSPVNPTELLNSERLGELISHMRTKYDYIFIDTPKASNMADTEIIARHADCSLHIVRAGMFERDNLATLEKKEGEESNRYVILNAVDTDDNKE